MALSLIDHWAEIIHALHPEWDDKLPDSTTWGSWWVTPRQFVIESILQNGLQIALLIYFFVTRTKSNPMPSAYRRSWLDYLLITLLVATFGVIMTYKCMDPNTLRRAFMLNPCHVYTVLLIWVWFDKSALARNAANVLLYLPMGGWLAIIFPDRTGYSPGLESWCYYIQHALIAVIPFYYVASRPKDAQPWSVRAWIVSFLCINLWHTTVLTGLALWTGLNLNFVLHPPKVGLLRLAGIYFRPWTMFLLCILIGMIQPIYLVVGRLLRTVLVKPLLAVGMLPPEPIHHDDPIPIVDLKPKDE